MSAQGLTGGKFDKTVPLATAGPGGNPNWQPGDAVKFLPPPDIPDARRGRPTRWRRCRRRSCSACTS